MVRKLMVPGGWAHPRLLKYKVGRRAAVGLPTDGETGKTFTDGERINRDRLFGPLIRG